MEEKNTYKRERMEKKATCRWQHLLTDGIWKKIHIVAEDHQKSTVERTLSISCQFIDSPVECERHWCGKKECEYDAVCQVANFVAGKTDGLK